MKTNETISSSIIALLMMMLFSRASHAATIVPQNGTVEQLTPVYFDSPPVEYYAEALADVETLVRFFLYLFSLSFSLFSRRNGRRTDRERCAKVRCNRARRERLALVVVVLVFGRRARLFLGALWMMMMMMVL